MQAIDVASCARVRVPPREFADALAALVDRTKQGDGPILFTSPVRRRVFVSAFMYENPLLLYIHLIDLSTPRRVTACGGVAVYTAHS